MARAFILVLDSFGIGTAPDSAAYGDQGANTLLHIAQQCADGKADSDKRSGSLKVPNLCQLGLDKALKLACNQDLPLQDTEPHINELKAAYAVGQEVSAGKDTPSGHWEMMGLPVMKVWGTFPKPKADNPAFAEGSYFPKNLLDKIYKETKLSGSLANCAASGTEVIAQYGAEHVKTGLPIFYTSSDSVFQVAAHEEVFGLDRLYELCSYLREEMNQYNVGRVIARPFTGNVENGFTRTNNRRDWTTPPGEPTLFDFVKKAGGTTIALGKIADIFAHQAIDKEIKAYGTPGLFDATLKQVKEAPDNSLVMTNFVDFDQTFGHRRDVAGYANELEVFDRLLPTLFPLLQEDDLLVITADHGCDPTWMGNDHTREYVPQLLFGKQVKPVSCGKRLGFADMGQSVAAWLGVGPLNHGISYLDIALGKSDPV